MEIRICVWLLVFSFNTILSKESITNKWEGGGNKCVARRSDRGEDKSTVCPIYRMISVQWIKQKKMSNLNLSTRLRGARKVSHRSRWERNKKFSVCVGRKNGKHKQTKTLSADVIEWESLPGESRENPFECWTVNQVMTATSGGKEKRKYLFSSFTQYWPNVNFIFIYSLAM